MTRSSRPPSRALANLPESIHQRLNQYALMASAEGVGMVALAKPAERSTPHIRRPANFSESVHHHLNQYALLAGVAGVGMLALANPAEAKIVYTPTHIKIPWSSFIQLDLNHDGIADFTFFDGGAITYSNLNVNPAQRGNAIRRAYSHFATALRAGVRVAGSGLDSKDRMYMAAWISNSIYNGPWANHGKGVKNRYLGLKFIVKGKTHFGWARLNVTVTKGGRGVQHFKGLLTGYAYETIPNKPIITGKTKGPDDIDSTVGRSNPPSLTAPARGSATLGLLATGSQGLSIWRRESVGYLP